ncbi:LAME_0G09274g1_1 [Lachancea meyersii CBS 8951]|uniref:LAME_0G09274g1_1 n=1 Tax=Lachancea meyersii CBS 8951 TaxID=1266667 RepID=A0A1G4K8K1_9SACH|nr:LAME_0G09274g1_1 [Lachancea meyersii CBS 8951]
MEFSSQDFGSANYFKTRPTYPAGFLHLLSQYHKGKRSLLIDVGCGPGNSTLELAKYLGFEQVWGSDVSPGMIETAKTQKELSNGEFSADNVQFSVHAAEDLDWVAPNAADMVTAAQCCHWLDFGVFQNAVFRTLRKGGTLAIWGYVDPHFADYPELDRVLFNFQYGEDQLGPYWEKPGRVILRDLLRTQKLDNSRFDDVLQVEYDPRNPETQSTLQIPLKVDRQMTVAEFDHYIESWSAYNAWKRTNKAKTDIRQHFMRKLRTHTGLSSSQSTMNVTWKTIYKFARKKS